MSGVLFVTDVAPYRDVTGAQARDLTHASLGQAAVAMEQLAHEEDLEYQHFAQVRAIGLDDIEQASVLALFTIGETAWSDEQRKAIEKRAADGGLGVFGIHSATDSAYGWPALGRLLGARFDGHPATGELSITVVDPAHPSTAHLASPWRFNDELYVFRDLAPEAQVLLAVGLGSTPSGVSSRDWHGPRSLPLAWCIEHYPTRTFYTALGHFPTAYSDEHFLQHLRGGLRWVKESGK